MFPHQQIHHRLSRFLEHTTTLTGTTLRDAFANEAIENGGNYEIPRADDTTTSHLVEIALHGIIGRGRTEPEAIENWQQAAQRQIDAMIEDDGFITVHPPFSTPHNPAGAEQ